MLFKKMAKPKSVRIVKPSKKANTAVGKAMLGNMWIKKGNKVRVRCIF